MLIKAKAKINIGLDILSKREDNYHNIKTIMKEIDLYDELDFETADSSSIITRARDIPLGEDNLIFKAKGALEGFTGRKLGFTVKLKKNIPVGAGLAGGSADAAATMKALNELYSLDLSLEVLQAIGKTVGADVPFCLQGGCMLAEGIGESLTPIEYNLKDSIILVFPNIEISTKDVYAGIVREEYGRVDIDGIIKSLGEGSFRTKERINIMESYVFQVEPKVGIIKERLYHMGARAAFMSGSGSSVVGFFQEDYDFSELEDEFKGMGFRVFVF
ncbi:MAG: 4-(cytidine 5'-diphospho)-2-C-methyl-D-erythritol kinase [Tissierellia bacterium]|nr:4-(cytidine 5'-diphospho)-2-C-methyl-D-erythritol kinase [Tissierellia bacterium]